MKSRSPGVRDRRLSLLADLVPALLWFNGPQGTEYVNQAYIDFVGTSEEDILGLRWARYLHDEDRERYLAAYQEAVGRRAPFEAEVRMRRHDGVYRWMRSQGCPVRGASGRWLGYVGTTVDVTEPREMEEALGRANEVLTRSNEQMQAFIYAASHDLREPLRVMMLNSQMLIRKSQAGQTGDTEELALQILTGARRMDALLQDLLDYVKVGQEGKVERGPGDCRSALETVLLNLEASIVQTGARISHGDLPVVAVPEAQLVLLFQNLISNALKYRGADPPIVRIDAEPGDGGRWRFSVRDNGIGIEPRYLGRIFGVFKRLHGDEYPGTGIGLAICTRIVERYGGRIWVESEPGRGSTFLFTLPGAGAA